MQNLNGQVAVRTISEAIASGFLASHGAASSLKSNELKDHLHQLIDERRDQDAIVLLAALLPIRLSVWWSCLCVWHSFWPAPTESDDRALRAATAWTVWPVEESRRTAEQIVLQGGVSTSAEFCAQAAALAGRIRGKEGPFEPAMPVLAAQAAGVAILQGARDAGIRNRDRFADWTMLQLGLRVARGELLLPKPVWEE